MIGDYRYESDFIVAFHQSEERAFNAVFEAFYKDLIYFAKKLINNTEVAEEIVSEVFLKLFKKSKDFPSVANIRAFLRIATRNACYNFLDKEKTLTKNQIEFNYLSVNQIQYGVDFVSVETELIERIARDIERLPQLPRKVFVLRYIKEYEAKRVAEELGITYQVVLNQTHKALVLLRKMNNQSVLLLLKAFFMINF